MPRSSAQPILRHAQAWLLWVTLGCGSLAAVEWTAHEGHRFAGVVVDVAGRTGFTPMLAPTTGLMFTNYLAEARHHTNQIYLNGSGVTAGDVDGDGWCDLFICGLSGRSALYRNLGGWKFADITAQSGLALTHLDATGAVLADFDGDGDLDLIVNSVGTGTFVFLNDGRGRFSFSASTPVLNRRRCGTSLALADLDGDGALDLYIANYRSDTIRDQPRAQFSFRSVNGQPEVTAIGGRSISEPDMLNRFEFRYRPAPGGGVTVLHDEQGEADAVFRNLGGGRFAPLSFTNGTFLNEAGAVLKKPPLDWGLSVMLRDFNGDGAPDIYVCNDFASPDRLWLNDRKGRFRAAPTFALRQTSLSSMGVDVADINRDGFDDFFVVDMLSREHWRRLVQRNEPNPNMSLFVDVAGRPQSPRNTLQLARGDGTYAEIAQLAGAEASEWSWTPIFLDVDLDGYEDLLVANGFERDFMNVDANLRLAELQRQAGPQASAIEHLGLRRHYPRLDTANLAFRNLGNLKFADVSAAWGFHSRGIGQGMCLADLDSDGDLDVIINNFNSAAELLRNDAPAPRVAVRLRGKAPNTRGIGARIKLLGGAVSAQTQEMICGGRYLSGDEAMRVFATGSPTNRMTLEVVWRNGTRSALTNVTANRIYEMDEATAAPLPPHPASRAPQQFTDVSSLLTHTNTHELFDDFERQPLLPHKSSTAGPGVSWFDVDGDGWDDLILPAGKGAKLSVFRNDRRGGFTPMTGRPFEDAVTRSQTAVLGWRQPDGHVALLAGSSNFEDGLTNGSVVRQYDVAGKTLDDSLPGMASTAGPLAMADVDGDGALDLFVGGRCVPGRWPEPASSLLFRQSGGRWVLDAENSRRLMNVGLVRGAVFTDLDGDGSADLVLACEWGPLRVFRNQRGKLTDATADFGFDKFTGWWTGVAAGDFDGDGRIDLMAANWGSNSKYESFRARPLQLFHGDFNGDGSVGIIESAFDETLQQYVPLFHLGTMAGGLPWLSGQFSTFESFSRASVGEALGDHFRSARTLAANWLESTVFLNRGGRFEARPLPIEAQFAPAFGVSVGDFDGDGHEDVFLGQNFFATRAEASRADAGRGLLLRGDGQGGFASVPGQESGLLIYGEQRGTAVADYDGDGRVDLAVTQAGGETRLFHNELARPGVRVRLRGPTGNPHGVGAVLRLKSGERLGPARELHAGAGYWSQDSTVTVLATPEKATALWCRWPGGKVMTLPLPPGATEVSYQLR